MSAFVQMPLAEVCTIVGGGTPRRSNAAYFDGAIPWARPTDVTSLDSLYIDQTKEAITRVGLKESSARLVPAGTVLMTSRATIGYTAIAAQPMATNQGFANLICGERVEPEFLAYWLRDQRERLIQLAGGTTFRELPKSTLKKVHIPLPPLDEQRRIVDILNRAAEIERLRKRAQERLQEFIPALFVKMFGDPVENPMGWPMRVLGDLCEMDRNTIKPSDPVASELRFVGVENVNSGTGIFNFETRSRVGELKSMAFRFDQRHVLYGKLRPYLNKVATPRFDGRCSTELVPLLPHDGIDRQFVAQLLRREETVAYVMSSVTGSRMPRTDMKALLSMLVPVPPLELQRSFATIAQAAQNIGNLAAFDPFIATLSESIMSCLLGTEP